MEIELITKTDYNQLLNLLIGIDTKLDQLIKSAPSLSGIWLDSSEVCIMLHVSSRTLQNYRDRGMLSFNQIGSKILYKRSDIEKFLDNHYISRSEY